MKKLLLLFLVGCGSFEDPQIVLDLREIGMRAIPPEQVVPFDPQHPPTDIADLGLVDTRVCGLVADPAESRGLHWKMRVCGPTDHLQCDDDSRPSFVIGEGDLEDPEEADTPQHPCATIPANAGLLVVLEDAIQHDPYGGFSGIDLIVELDVTGGDETIVGAKRVRYAAQLPADRVANQNPTLQRLSGEGVPMPRVRCADDPVPLELAPGDTLHLTPVEPDTAREDYVVPTLDGGEEHFTETLTYEWLATAGSWNRGTTGGARDASGMMPPLDSTWTAPDADTLDGPTDVSIWNIQRDERLGETWIETCVRVVP